MRKALSTYLENVSLTPTIGATFTFPDLAGAHTQVQSGTNIGRVVVTV